MQTSIRLLGEGTRSARALRGVCSGWNVLKPIPPVRLKEFSVANHKEKMFYVQDMLL